MIRPRAKKKCCRCKSTVGVVRHHIIYIPERIANLCRRCHGKISMVNAAASIITGTRQSNKIRAYMWQWFLQYTGSIKPEKVAIALGIDFKFTNKQITFINEAYKRTTKRIVFARRGK